ncbi:MgtC/SapB family protein [Nannocystis punicea]|uniref:MgtC/SapB family protein n=1 Tax=Nannocystis punicea TaxID=2995304 RepID=A0ABY7GUY4_9BACT|nr:MgtC/SapB family protein [Nannocystis poenicansa]WAS90639.1 MgtC/SapB family protein [Nannocystis poenicansa]
MDAILIGHELDFLIRIAVCLLCGTIIGVERELRNKPAGISTNCFVIAGACLFTFISQQADPVSPARIAAQVVSGVGFLGAGMILKAAGDKITNLTTAASVWFAAAVGMSIGMGWYIVAAIATIYAVLVPRIPHVKTWVKETPDE